MRPRRLERRTRLDRRVTAQQSSDPIAPSTTGLRCIDGDDWLDGLLLCQGAPIDGMLAISADMFQRSRRTGVTIRGCALQTVQAYRCHVRCCGDHPFGLEVGKSGETPLCHLCQCRRGQGGEFGTSYTEHSILGHYSLRRQDRDVVLHDPVEQRIKRRPRVQAGGLGRAPRLRALHQRRGR
jgi:hypothetical protein